MKGNKGLAPGRRKQIQDIAVTANQWQSNPRQQLFLKNYFDPGSKTFGNVFQSAINAGYRENYARSLTSRNNKNMWLKEYLGNTQFTEEHILAGITNIATSPQSRQSEKLNALLALAKLKGMIVDKSVVGHVNIEQAIADLK